MVKPVELHGKVIYSPSDIEYRASQLAEQIVEREDIDELLLIGLLTGASYFMQDIIRHMGKHKPLTNPDYDYLRVSNYAGGVRAQGPRILGDLSTSTQVEGRPVILIDDMSDTGESNQLAKRHIIDLGAKSVEECVMINRVFDGNKDSHPEMAAFDYDDWKWLVGRGLDGPGAGFGGARALPYVAECIVQPEAPQKDTFA